MPDLTIVQALQAARQSIPISEARLLLGALLDRNLAWLEAHRDDALEAALRRRFEDMVARRASGEPVAYLLGVREFFGRDFSVSPAVLIPRPDTEVLVETALEKLRGMASPKVLDLGTGSGCIAVTLALEAPHAAVTAIDASAVALEQARANGERLGAQVRFLHGDWFAPVAGEHFDVIVSNPPYIADADPHLSQGDLRFEPASALSSGPVGLDDIRRIAAAAPNHLTPGGWLMLEHGYDQAEAVAEILAANGFTAIEQQRDLADIIRVTLGRID